MKYYRQRARLVLQVTIVTLLKQQRCMVFLAMVLSILSIVLLVITVPVELKVNTNIHVWKAIIATSQTLKDMHNANHVLVGHIAMGRDWSSMLTCVTQDMYVFLLRITQDQLME